MQNDTFIPDIPESGGQSVAADAEHLRELSEQSREILRAYRRILTTYGNTNRQLRENLRLAEDISRAIARNAEQLSSGNIAGAAGGVAQSLLRHAGIRDNTGGVFGLDQLAEALTGAVTGQAVNAPSPFRSSYGQAVLELSQILGRAARNS